MIRLSLKTPVLSISIGQFIHSEQSQWPLLKTCSKNHFRNSSGYDSSPVQRPQKCEQVYTTSAYASEEESEIVLPPPRKLPAGAVAMPHMMAL